MINLDANKIGKEGEQIARKIIKNNFNPSKLLQLDWIFKQNDKWFSVEVKHKEMFTTPPFNGHGLDNRQIEDRLLLQKEKDIRAIFIAIDLHTKKAYWNYIDKLMDGQSFLTRYNIRIFPLKSYNVIEPEITETPEDISDLIK